MIEFEDESKSPKEKGKPGRPRRTDPTKKEPVSLARSAATKAKVRDEAGRLIGKRQILLKIDYNVDEQRYTLESTSGDKKIREEEKYFGIIPLKKRIDKLLNRWRSGLS